MTAVNLLQKYFKQLSYYTALVLYLDKSAISNQIKYYFTANREMQYGLFLACFACRFNMACC